MSAPAGPPQGRANQTPERVTPANRIHPLPQERGRGEGTPLSGLGLITECLLHRGPMLLVDEVLEQGAGYIVVGTAVDAKAWYAQADGSMPAWVGIELMAQAIGAHSGLESRALGEAPQLGYLLGTRAYRSRVPSFPANARLTIVARCVFRDESGLGAFDCELWQEGELLAESTLKVYETPRGSA